MPRPPQDMLYPIVGDFNLIRMSAYKLESLSIDGSPVKDARLVQIVPQELTNSLVFSDRKGNIIGNVPGSEIHDVSITTETKGRIVKRQDQVIEILYQQGRDRREHTAILNVEDKYISDIYQAINTIISNVTDENYWAYRSLTFTPETAQTKTIGIYFSARFMAQEEEIVG
jgi:hypothetical protein